jgi:hypothetical protein
LRPEFCNEAREALSPDPHLQHVLPHVGTLDEQLDDPRLLGREQLGPDRGELRQQDRDSRSVISSSPSRCAAAQVRATSSGAASSFWT